MRSRLSLALAVAMTATGALAAPTGEDLFKLRCTSCHSLQPAPGKLGPPLAGVAGRKAAAAPGYAYSAALKGAGLTWTPAALDAYLRSPGKAVPGTKMQIGVPDAVQRAAVIDYLGTLKK